ncbi:plasmid mobilization relaxosome protein MobC [Sphingobacterium sp. FBM7-1]|uniref:plasmid mobilization relaxosome protein MobC n=1 Tax=Sphingobacterium sp. FBM7-1 TaxID=2886688 RepID=UPI001D0FC99B|nr:plasmid mobilization relaxosome protein MobC [Sphingobacterium sp. FBM7-1]MCC2600821.1 MobC family plasmid mobilization relaxosome protein [Sphingobacterium sp. FBM7-1]
MEKTEYSKLSQYIRYKCLLDIDVNKNLLVANSLKDELKVFNYEINRIGNNINQIAKAIYTNNISHKSAIEELQNDMKYLYKFAIDLNKKISDR